MTHEKECAETCDTRFECICSPIRVAYARGREDAAQAIIREIGGTQDDGNISTASIPKHGWHQIDVAEACIAAARGSTKA